ncbi:enoyl-CoA hydratase/isomerase family protein [Pseudomonas sp. YL-218 TE3947]|uniref:enoyl-CoA hydratase/isomerase family protein n=1 Tax=Pseudomonas TaxID=286 RepID=UPI003D213FAE
MGEAKVHKECHGPVAVLTLDAPPVNSFSLSLRLQLYSALQWAAATECVKAVVLTGSGRGFSAGGDIREFGTARASAAPGLSSHIHLAIEQLGKPVIAAVHGFAMGGGLETSLACHYRVAEQGTVLGLPEVSLGTLPLSATQRLPRVLGIVPAVQFMIEGHQKTVSEFSHTALFDRIVDPGQGLSTACALATELVAMPPSNEELQQRLIRHWAIPGTDIQRDLAEARQCLSGRQDAASRSLFEAVEAGASLSDFDAGMDCARRLYDQLMAGDEILRGRDRFLESAPENRPRVDPAAP